MSEGRRNLVERGYDSVAEQCLAAKDPDDPAVLSALEEAARGFS